MSKKIIIILFFLNGCVTENTARNWVNKCIEDAEEYVSWMYPKCMDGYMNYYIKYCEFNAPRQGFIFLKTKIILIITVISRIILKSLVIFI